MDGVNELQMNRATILSTETNLINLSKYDSNNCAILFFSNIFSERSSNPTIPDKFPIELIYHKIINRVSYICDKVKSVI